MEKVNPSSAPEQENNSKMEESVPEILFPKANIISPLKAQGLSTDLFRAILILLCVFVAIGFLLILLPQKAIDKMEDTLQSRNANARTEKIALLYLGDQTNEGRLWIRGIVRNITPRPIEQLDTVIRFNARDGSFLETILVRMDKEIIGPGEIARLELVVPNQTMQYAGYSVEFKLRRGESVAYKDMRGLKSPQ